MYNSRQQSLLEAYDHGDSYEVCANAANVFQSQKKRFFSAPPLPVKNWTVTVNPAIPRLAWICEIVKGEYNFTLGNKVEQGEKFIVEGVWDGAYAESGFGFSDHFYGTGAFINSEGVCEFVPPRLCTDYLFVLHDNEQDKTWVSNSFCFIFQKEGVDLEGNFYRQFKAALNRTTNTESALGADRGSPLIARDKSWTMYRLMYHNFTVGERGGINFLTRNPRELEIKTFNDYRGFLLGTTRAIIQNGAARQRKQSFGAITMLSTGYDSCAVSAICAEAGVKTAVTLDVVTMGHDDCGDKIAAALGLDCRKVASPLGKNVRALRARLGADRKEYLEFIATPGIGDNLAFCNMADFIRGKIVFSGLYGDGCWSLEGNGGGLAHHLPYMKSRNEFRLRVGYFLAPPPAFGAYFPYVLKRISAGADLEPYRLGNDYDRPVPRRIAEEAGVARELFGRHKAANNPDILNWKQLFDEAVREVMRRYE